MDNTPPSVAGAAAATAPTAVDQASTSSVVVAIKRAASQAKSFVDTRHGASILTFMLSVVALSIFKPDITVRQEVPDGPRELVLKFVITISLLAAGVVYTAYPV